MAFTLNITEREFDKTLEEIDRKMVSLDVPVRARQLRGWMLFCEQQQLDGISMNDPVSEKVMNWFKARYEERLNIGDFGASVVLARGDILRFRCPLFFGRLLVICYPPYLGKRQGGLAVNKPGLLNALNQFDSMTQALADSFSSDDLLLLHKAFVDAQIARARIVDAGSDNFVSEARADIGQSVELLCAPEPQYGPSKWASLQAVEKFLKAYIANQGQAPKYIHELPELAKAAESLGLPAVDRAQLGFVQCAASVRYDRASVNKADAVKAHGAAISICAEISEHLKGWSGWKTRSAGDALVSFEGNPNRIPAYVISRTK